MSLMFALFSSLNERSVVSKEASHVWRVEMYCRLLLAAAAGFCWLLLAAAGCCHLLLAAAGCYWLLLAVSGCC